MKILNIVVEIKTNAPGRYFVTVLVFFGQTVLNKILINSYANCNSLET